MLIQRPKIWDEIYSQYPKSRDEMEREEEIVFVNKCFDAYESHEELSKVFWSRSEDYEERQGQAFEVIGRVPIEGSDLECLPMWKIRFVDGHETTAYPEEIYLREMIEHGYRPKQC